MKSKLGLYIICVISRGQNNINDGEQYFIELDNIEEVKDILKDLKDNNQDMNYVTVFPKYTGIIGDNFNIK